jgi:hypothetical protein
MIVAAERKEAEGTANRLDCLVTSAATTLLRSRLRVSSFGQIQEYHSRKKHKSRLWFLRIVRLFAATIFLKML